MILLIDCLIRTESYVLLEVALKARGDLLSHSRFLDHSHIGCGIKRGKHRHAVHAACKGLSRLGVILVLISFHGAFLSSSRFCGLATGTRISNTVSIARWLEPCSVPCIAHLTMEPVRF